MSKSIVLNPVHGVDNRKSYYGKAHYTVESIQDSTVYTLYSYNTPVLRITTYEGHPNHVYFDRRWWGYSATTMRHINSFVATVTDMPVGGKKWWDSL